MEENPTREVLGNYTFEAALSFLLRNTHAVSEDGKDCLLAVLRRLYQNREAQPTMNDYGNVAVAMESAVHFFEYHTQNMGMKADGVLDMERDQK